jgi:hypothetical protein
MEIGNLAEWVQAGAGVATLATAIVGVVLGLGQLKQLSASARSDTNQRLTTESFDVLRFLADYEGTYEYFYNSKEPEEVVHERLKYATEMLANYLEHVVLQLNTLPIKSQESWKKLTRDTYSHSPLLREHLRKYKAWYDESLYDVVEGVEPSAPEPIRSQAS